MHPEDILFHVSQLKALIDLAHNQYHQLVLLLGESWEERTKVLLALSENTEGMEYLPLGRALSQALLEINTHDRPLMAADIIETQLPTNQAYMALDHLEILFAPELQVDPLRLLQTFSRERRIIVSWPGQYEGNKLTYAVPSHREYYVKSVTGLICYRI